MFGWLKRDPVTALRKRYESKMKEAVDLQRRGDIPAFAIATAEAEELHRELRALEAAQASSL